MNNADARDRGVLTLLVQLFGREVLDRLARAGFDDEAAIARVGPDRLAAESGISLPVAQRIVAVVEETRGPSPGAQTKTDGEPARPPRRRKAPGPRPASKTPATRLEAAPAPMDKAKDDPFVDDVALVTWMGFSSKTPSGRLTFSVADGILDTARREPPAHEEARGGAPEEAPVPPPITATTGTPSRAQGGPGTPPPRTLPGSFWSFGRPAELRSTRDDEAARPPGHPRDPEAPAGAPLRRDRHDH